MEGIGDPHHNMISSEMASVKTQVENHGERLSVVEKDIKQMKSDWNKEKEESVNRIYNHIDARYEKLERRLEAKINWLYVVIIGAALANVIFYHFKVGLG